MKRATLGQAATLLSALILAACGGGADTTANNDAGSGPGASCDPAESATYAECGTVLVGLTDAQGDFLDYTVDVTSLKLETAGGRVVEVLPATTRIDFSDYFDLTELVTAAYVPPAVYVAGSISLDYGNAEIVVEAGDTAKNAIVTDVDGVPLGETELRIVLPNRDRLTVSRRSTQFLQLDFDLEASHVVDTDPTPATATIEQFIVAEVHPVDEKSIRARGPLVDVSEADQRYTIALRPWHLWHGDFGKFDVYVTDATEFEVDGTAMLGVEGLRALDAAGPGTPTVAAGAFATADRTFTADLVLAGSSVPGYGYDAVVGNIVSRNGNRLTIHGATVIPREAAASPDSAATAHFRDDVVVEIGPDTKVYKDGDPGATVTIDDLSIGQRVTVRGNQSIPMDDTSAPRPLVDAKSGAVRMHVTRLAGTVNTVLPGQTDIDLLAIDRRPVDLFDFAGTGPSADLNADPENYEVRTDALPLVDFAIGEPIVVLGFPTAFGMAPPDFSGRSAVDYSDARSTLGLGWGEAGTAAPFVALGPDGIVLDNGNLDVGERHYLKQGPVWIDLTTLDSDTTIVPHETDRLLFSIKTGDSLRLYSDWTGFVDDLATSLGGGSLARSMHAYGQYDAATNTLHAYKLGICLLAP